MAQNAPKRLLFGLVMLSVVYVVPGELTPCLYMQTTIDSEPPDGESVLVLQFNHTMWKQCSGSSSQEFAFNSWNWSELDSFASDGNLAIIFNGLEVPYVDRLQGHDSVVCLNLDENHITGVEMEAFADFKSLTTLSMRGNMITAVNDFFYIPNKLKHLDLSNNWISDINRLKSFRWDQLRHLNLSHNRLESLRTELSKLEALETLDLSHNSIKSGDKPIILSRKLRRLRLDHNELTVWPFDSLPDTLEELSLSFNQLEASREATKEAPTVRLLNLSGNRLAAFCGQCFPSLVELDLSSNYFTTLPRLGNHTSALRKVRFNRMPHLRTVEKGTFDEAEHLQEIEISFCPGLANIEPHAFTGLRELKRLDLSYNALPQVPENMVHWKQLTEGVDLQGNPINCNCSMQWFVNKVIPAMHAHPALHTLFPKLRCTQPAMYRDYLLVYLTVHDNLLCRKYREMDLPGMEQVLQSMKEHRQMQWVRVQKIILACLIVGIVAMSLYLAYLKCSQPRYRVRPIYYYHHK